MWGKILTGVAIGVGAVAAAPFTGGGSLLGGATLAASLTGAGTVAAATGAGLVGAAAGGVLAEEEENKRKRAVDKARAEAKAEADMKIKELEKILKSSLNKLKSHDEHFRAIIALEAVGVSCAACDGDFSDNEKEEIGEFVKGMLAQKIPDDVKEKIQTIYENPPSIEEAFQLAKESGIKLNIFEDLVQFVMEIDGVKPEEEAFTHAWNQLKDVA